MDAAAEGLKNESIVTKSSPNHRHRVLYCVVPPSFLVGIYTSRGGAVLLWHRFAASFGASHILYYYELTVFFGWIHGFATVHCPHCSCC
mmetsp:Transcript_9825/g.20572  ORF Transcript_9825/g.20572 Transcript_9825/m.20572 type:complete len:89 (+) Transcript_9825:775-1041(+)